MEAVAARDGPHRHAADRVSAVLFRSERGVKRRRPRLGVPVEWRRWSKVRVR